MLLFDRIIEYLIDTQFFFVHFFFINNLMNSVITTVTQFLETKGRCQAKELFI